MKNVIPQPVSPNVPRVDMSSTVLYLAQHKTQKAYVTAMRLTKEVLIIGTGGFHVIPNASGKPAQEFFQDVYSIIRPLSKGEQVVLEV